MLMIHVTNPCELWFHMNSLLDGLSCKYNSNLSLSCKCVVMKRNNP